jgi:hypothetical protein
MTLRQALIAAALCFSLACYSQEPSVIPLSSEPHHHLVLHNEFVNVYAVEVSPHDAVQLHKHEADAIGIMLSDSEITVHAPGKPDSHQTVINGQLRLQSVGYVHSTSIDGDTPYRNVTVELLAPQGSPRNLCAAVIAGQPVHCPKSASRPNADGSARQPQFQTNETEVALIRILSRQSATLDAAVFPQLVVVLDDVNVASGASPGNNCRAGEFLWRDTNAPAQVFKNDSANAVRLVAFCFKKEKSAK